MDLHGAADFVGLAIDGAGVGVIVVSIVVAALRFARATTEHRPFEGSYRLLRLSIGRGILLGLELLIAGDIIRTVAITPTFTSIGIVALIVAIRTFLSFSLEVELTGRWPWQPRPTSIAQDMELRVADDPAT